MGLAYIGIGSNLDQPRKQVERAINALKLLSVDEEIKVSSIYQSAPMTIDSNSQQDEYINAVVRINSSDTPIDLLDALQNIENTQGRVRTSEHWIARTLDLDLLLFDDLVINLPRLTVPHYGLQQRNFVIYPLFDIDVNLILPDKTTIKSLYESCSADGIRKIE
ncbi:MAG: 2-amino-4-hydroxy-6-hydroxymethyldihydropteridine diphosphokinase [Gammaproteobacteria bacterium]|nr:2-amino-4-hydroxy-6-hydroxymethyldihydropteridine diphosphokinase [Gammaproteobacteria bacterium]